MSKFSSQTCELVAETLCKQELYEADRCELARMFASKFAADNPCFDREKFLAAALPK